MRRLLLLLLLALAGCAHPTREFLLLLDPLAERCTAFDGEREVSWPLGADSTCHLEEMP